MCLKLIPIKINSGFPAWTCHVKRYFYFLLSLPHKFLLGGSKVFILFLFALWLFTSLLWNVSQLVKNPPAMQETWVRFLGREDPLEKGTATHSSIPAWRNPWTDECGRLQAMGSQRVRYDWATFTTTTTMLNIEKKKRAQMHSFLRYEKTSARVATTQERNHGPHLHKNPSRAFSVSLHSCFPLHFNSWASLSTTVSPGLWFCMHGVPVHAFFYVWLHSANTLCILSMFWHGSCDLCLLTVLSFL